jgi:hypothetical protein
VRLLAEQPHHCSEIAGVLVEWMLQIIENSMFSRVHIDADLAGGVKQACFSMPTSGCFNYLTNMSWDGLKPPTSSFVG